MNNKKIQYENLIWKDLYPNNMKCNGKEGIYTIIQTSETSAKKFTILFTRQQSINGEINLNDPIKYYVLFQENYIDVKGPFEYPESNNGENLFKKSENTFSDCEINHYGTFTAIFDNLEDAKKRAYTSYSHIENLKKYFLD